MTWDQWIIFVFGVGGVALANLGGRWQRWAPVLGLAGQVGWLHATIEAHQWGMVGATACYTGRVVCRYLETVDQARA